MPCSILHLCANSLSNRSGSGPTRAGIQLIFNDRVGCYGLVHLLLTPAFVEDKTDKTKLKQAKRDRKLGDEWHDWNGAESAESQAGKRLFFTLLGVFIVTCGLVSVLGWYLVMPRLAQWHPLAPMTLLLVLSVIVLALLLALMMVVGTLFCQRPLPRPLSRLAMRFLTTTERKVFSLGGTLSVNRDRLAHSFVKIHNNLVRLNNQRTDPARILVLLPRCLLKEQIKEANALSDHYGVKVAVVAGGELARKRVVEYMPQAIIGVACERDLLSGIRDTQTRVSVLGIPNARPNGPCKDTTIDMAQLKEAIELCIHRPATPC